MRTRKIGTKNKHRSLNFKNLLISILYFILLADWINMLCYLSCLSKESLSRDFSPQHLKSTLEMVVETLCLNVEIFSLKVCNLDGFILFIR